MQVPTDAVLARIFLGERDRGPGGHPLYEAVVLKAREMHLAGATVLRGPMGFGRNSRLHTAKILRLSDDLPMVVEIVDAEEKVRAFLEAIEPMMGSGLVTLERVQVIRYGAPRRGRAERPLPAGREAEADAAAVRVGRGRDGQRAARRAPLAVHARDRAAHDRPEWPRPRARR